ncbi:MAG: N-acetyl-alpha-D-glucosaminyl L-malate synthase BshA [Bacteroidia bacterium]|nr:N-acetyl-alpha-D-glucosaminyl L-malate synthase BshA [Bacteroidia bacterium]
MNIGIVCYPTYGGSGVLATELGKALAQKGHSVHFISYDKPVRLSYFEQNIIYHEVRPIEYPVFHYIPYESSLSGTIVEVARFYGLDLLHVHYAVPHATSACLARDILKQYDIHLPIVTTLHGTDITLVGKEEFYSSVVTYSINQSDAITSVSEFLRKATYQFFEITKEIDVVPNFVDFERFSRRPKQVFKSLLAPNQEKLIVHASNFRAVKRPYDVLAVFEKIRTAIASKLIMVGDGPERSHLERLVREKGLNNCVIFPGKQDCIEDILSIGDLFLLPSESESFGLAALEAMACEVPVIATDVGGLPELITHDQNGILCPMGATDAMAAAAIEILTNPTKHDAMAKAALTRAKYFSLENSLAKYEAIYHKITSQA